MNISDRKRLSKVAFYASLCVLVTLIFQYNILSVAPQNLFHNFQLNGMTRVLGGIVADARGIDKKGANLGKIYRGTDGDPFGDPVPMQGYLTIQTFDIFPNYSEEESVIFNPYRSHYGLQAIGYSFLHRWLGLSKIYQLELVSSGLTALSIVILVLLYRRIYDNLFAFLFLIALVASPWFVSMGRNLYWSPFLFFLPSIFAALLYLERRTAVRLLLLMLIFTSLLAKSLSNYEFLTTVTLLACSVFIAAPYFDRRVVSPRPDFKMATIVFGVCVLAFVVAILVHAETKGETLLEGVKNIVERDMMRRTYGDASQFTNTNTQASLNASPLDVLAIYVFEWPGKRIMILPGKLFWAMLALSVAGITFKFLVGHPTRKRDLVLFVTFFTVPVSWFVFGKGHAHSHTHLCWVLWYIGFIPALTYVSIHSGIAILQQLKSVLGKPKGVRSA